MSSIFLERIEIEMLDSNCQEIENCYHYLKSLLSGETQDSEILKILSLKIQSGDLERVSKGLVYGILSGMDWLRFLLAGSQDLLQTACITFTSMVPSLKSKTIGLKLFMNLWKLSSRGFTDLFLTFLRTYDIIPEIKNELEWVKNSTFISLIFYKSIRLATNLLAEGNPMLSEYTYTISYLWRNKRESCLSIGRDLMRIISPLSEVNGLEVIWNDLFSPSRDGVPLYWALLCTPTHPRYHSVLLAPPLESKLVYVIEKANPCNYTRYLKWITEEFDENVIPDIVRFIVTFPSSVESVPRWQIIAWLLTCSPDHHVQANTKQSLIFDCLFYNQQDQIHTIEPLMSILKFSISRFPQVAEEILEFLLTSAELYDKRSVAGMMRSLKECFNIAYYNRIIPSLESLISEEKIDCSIRSRISDLFDTSGSGSEPSQSPIYDKETPPGTPRPYELLGEFGNDFVSEPSFEKLVMILQKNNITKELAGYVLKCISHEFTVPINPDLQRNSIYYQIFNNAQQDEKITELLKLLVANDSAVGIRLLIFTILNKSNLYFKYEYNLERDLKSCSYEGSVEALSFIYPYLLTNQLFSPRLILNFLANSTSELFYYTEIDLKCNRFKLLSPFLEEVLKLSTQISSVEKIYLWRLINAEISFAQSNVLIDFCTRNYSAENWSGLMQYFRIHSKSFNKETAVLLLNLPLHLSTTVSAILARVDIGIIEQAVTHLLMNLNTICLSHIKFWYKNKVEIFNVMKSRTIQDNLVHLLQGSSNDLAEEFNCLLETNRKLYTI